MAKAKDLRAEVEALKIQVQRLVQTQRALGLPTSPWVSPERAAKLIGTSRSRIQDEIVKAEHARATGQKYDLLWGIHYRKNGQHWQVNPVEFEAIIFLPPDQRPYLKVSS